MGKCHIKEPITYSFEKCEYLPNIDLTAAFPRYQASSNLSD